MANVDYSCLPPTRCNVQVLQSLPVGGRLKAFAPNWEVLGDPFVSETLSKGFRVPVRAAPPLTTTPNVHQLPPEHLAVVQLAVDTLVEKRAVVRLPSPPTSPGFYSPIFTVPKKNSSKRRLIHNMKWLNKNVLLQPPKFRLVNVPQLRRIIQPGDFMVSLDLSDAYLHVPIHPESQHLLRFILRGQHYQWVTLPFGISWAPWLFTRITTPIRVFLQLRGICIPMYLDDFLMFGNNSDRLLEQLAFTRRLLHQLGWLVNVEKSDLIPVQRLQFIGGVFDTLQEKLFVPEERFSAFLPLLRQALSLAPLSLRRWQVLLGHLTAAQYATRRGRLHLRPVQRFLLPLIYQGIQWVRRSLDTHLIPHLEWWCNRENVLEGIPLRDFKPEVEMFSDASKLGWGAHLGNLTVAGEWDATLRFRHINSLEMLAVIEAIRHWSSLLQHKALMVNTDNQSVVASINFQGTTRSQGLLDATLDLFLLCDEFNIDVRAKHIPGVRNVLADALSRPNRSMATEWSLHPEIFRQLQNSFDVGAVDLFATRINYKLPLFVSPYPDPKAWKVDALNISWENLVAYAYPPPALLNAVVDKIRATVSLKITLIAPWWPARPWFPILVALADEVTPLPSHPHLLRDNLSRTYHPNPDMFHLHAWSILRSP